MIVLFRALPGFLVYLVLSALATAFIYGPLAIFLWWLVGEFAAGSISFWMSIAVVAIIFLCCCIRSARKPLTMPQDMEWDSGTTGEVGEISPVVGLGGLWNVNPLGPNSSRSILRIVVGLFCFGPALLVEGIRYFVRLQKVESTTCKKRG